MSRMLSSFVVGAWGGFLAVTGLGEASHALGRSELFGIVLEAPSAGGVPAGILAALLLGVAGLMLVALVRIQSRHEGQVRQGELLAFAGIGVCAAMVVAAAAFGAPFAALFDRLDLAFWSVGLSLLALAFDAVIFEPGDADDEMAYRKALVSIEAMPRTPDRAGENRKGGV